MHKHKHTTIAILLSAILHMSWQASVYAIGTETSIVLRPHCLMGYEEDNNVLESGGDAEAIQCPSFSVEDPQTLRTPELSEGDILDIDVVVENPDKAEIMRVRSWLSYDPAVLKGDSVAIDEALPIVTPGEDGFSESEGYVKIEGSAEGNGPEEIQILVARVQFTVLKSVPAGTVITFYDVQKDGHTTVTTGTGEEQQHILTREPGALHILFASEEQEEQPETEETVEISESSSSEASSAEEASSSASSETAANEETQTTLLPDGEACITSAQCRSSHCTQGVCQAAGALIPDGGACGENAQCHSGKCASNSCVPATGTPAPASALSPIGGICQASAQCLSGLCSDGYCIPSLDAQIQQGPSSAAASSLPSAAFGLLQIQNVRITTEGTSVFLGWEALKSSQLQGYNIYYGTTTGRYIQRKTVNGNVQSLAIRSLPEGTTYYFALRAVSITNQESAFSSEVAVTVGDPKTATAPLAAGSIPKDAGPGKNPVQASVTENGGTVPGETGIPSTVAIFAIISAVIGTGFASRRQMIALTGISQS
jgi:hypothetical protein